MEQDRLLSIYAWSPINKELVYQILLKALQSKDFQTFRSIIEKQPTHVINHIYSNATEDTCLDIASKRGLTQFVKLLLSEGVEPNRINKARKRASIHFATEGRHAETLTILLEHPTINLNLEADHQTALHIAVKNDDRICADLLLARGASASIANSKGMTAIHLAATKGQCEMVKLILLRSSRCLDLDTYKDYNDQTAREVIRGKLPGVALPSPLMQEYDVTQGQEERHACMTICDREKRALSSD